MGKIAEADRIKYILYAEDDIDDRFMFKTLLEQINPDIGTVLVDNGLQAIKYLITLQENESFPCFILLDINMPVMNGFTTLKEIKSDPRWNSIPVIMYTTSNFIQDLQAAHIYGAENIITKPFRVEDIRKVISEFASYCEQLPEIKK